MPKKSEIDGTEIVSVIPSTTDPTLVKFFGGTQLDAFGRLRVSDPLTIFDSKQTLDNAPLFWDDSEVSGATTTSTHSTATASSTMGVAATTAGKRVRQTFMRFNYQPGKSQNIYMTGVMDLSGGGTGITRGIGMFDDNNGLFFQDDEGTMKVVVRSKTSGSAVDTKVTQASWDDPLDGTGASGITIDWTKTQVFAIDFEWLGVGSVRFCLVIDGAVVNVHTVKNANNLALVYMSTPCLPLRYEIDNDGTGAASTMMQICATVISEGGISRLGALRYKSTGGTHIDCNTADTAYALVAIRLKAAALEATVLLEGVSVLAETNDDFEWFLALNPTVASAVTFGDETNSTVQSAVGESANPSLSTITGGTMIQGGFADASSGITFPLANALRLGSTISGTPDEIYLCARPLSANANIQGSLTWREVS